MVEIKFKDNTIAIGTRIVLDDAFMGFVGLTTLKSNNEVVFYNMEEIHSMTVNDDSLSVQ
jgi:hypothetical protein